MERTEGKAQFGRNSNPEEIMLVVGKNRDYLATVRIRQAGGGAVSGAMEEMRIANAKDLLYRWNLCEPDGPVDKLVKALEEVQQDQEQIARKMAEIAVTDKTKELWEKTQSSSCKIATEALAAYRKDALTAKF